MVVGENDERRTGVLIDKLDFLLHDVVVFLDSLFFETHFGNFFGKQFCATVEDRKFGCVHLDKAVVDSGSIE